jgi:phosphoglycolate phosphatase
MLNYKLIIFDWDGTLMDSIDKIVYSMQSAALTGQLVVPSAENVQQIIGLSLPIAIATLFPDNSEKQTLALVEEYKRQYVEVNTTPTPLFEGAIELLNALKNESKLLAVATGKGRAGLQRVLDATQTQTYFHSSRSSDDAKSKPHPEMLYSLLDELGVAKEEAIMIGDTSHDLSMAQAAGIDRIGVTFGVHSKEILEQFKPKAVVNSLSELQALLIGK